MSDGNENIDNDGKVVSIEIQDEMKGCFIDYAMSVIISRALPDVRDGLKPVHRRILYSMHTLNNYHGKPYVKSARVVGDVIGKYHPHGDSSVYGTVVRMAQDFSLRYTLVDGQGNFGSIDGDSAAAMRYTEVRMEKITDELLSDIEKNTVEWQANYDDSLQEPVVLPSRIPNLLVNGTTGIAVGMATNIPPHNLREVMGALIKLVDNPELSLGEVIEMIPGPDFPTAGTIQGTAGIKSAYHTGKGIIQIRANAEIESNEKSGRERIIIKDLPYQVIKAKLIEKIAYMVNNKEIEGISDIKDESNRLGIRVVIDIKRGDNANVVLNRLYKQTQLQVSYGIILLAIHDGRPRVMNLKEMLTAFIAHRREVIVRRTIFDLEKARAKAHILEGLRIAVENLDDVVNLIKKSAGPAEAKQGLKEKYNLSDIQAQAILDMRLQRLTGLEQEKIISDYNEILKEIAKLEEILNSAYLVNEIIKNEFIEINDKYGDERRTEIVANNEEILIEDLIKEEEVIVTITRKGFAKRMTLDTYKTQKRGGTGVKGADMDDDFYTRIFIVNTHSDILFFTNLGNVFTLKVYQIPEGTRTAKGRNLVNLLQLASGETVKEIVPIPKDAATKFLVIATEKGLIKKTELEEYVNVKQSGKKAIKLVEGDSIINVRILSQDKDILMCATSGKSIRFSGEDLRPLGRVSQGVKGMDLDDNEKIVGMEVVDDMVEILTVTQSGYGKRTKSPEYRKQGRGGKGILAMKLTEKTGDIVQIKPVTEKDDLMIITNSGQVIRTSISGISLLGRNTQGVRLIRLKEGEKVVAVENFIEEE